SQGRERGYLTFEEIAGTLEEVEVTKEQVHDLHTYLIEHGVDVIAEDGLTAYKEAKEGNQPGQSKKPELDLTVEPSLDSLRLYLRSIGRVDLLTAPEEIERAKRIERRDIATKRHIVRVAQMPISLEKPVGDEEESELGDFVADDRTEEPFDTATERLQREDIQKALDALPERERQVIELRYGLRGHEPLTLEEVGRAFGVTRERIRQIENNTLKKLKQLPEAQRLRELA